MIGVRALKQTRLGVARIVAGKTFSRLPREVDTRRTRLAGALPRSYRVTPDIPDRRRATQQKRGQATPADSLKESQLAARSRPSPRRRTSPTRRIETASLREQLQLPALRRSASPHRHAALRTAEGVPRRVATVFRRVRWAAAFASSSRAAASFIAARCGAMEGPAGGRAGRSSA